MKASLKVSDYVLFHYDGLFPTVAWTIPVSIPEHEDYKFFVLHGHCDHILVANEYQSSREWENRFPGLWLLNSFVSIPYSSKRFQYSI